MAFEGDSQLNVENSAVGPLAPLGRAGDEVRQRGVAGQRAAASGDLLSTCRDLVAHGAAFEVQRENEVK